MSGPTIWWIRRDLRLRDNPALAAAAHAGEVVPLFVLDDALWKPAGPARRAYLSASLADLDRALDGRLVVRHGQPARAVRAVAREVEATGVFAAADFGPYGRTRDDEVEGVLGKDDVELHWVGSPYAVEPGSVVKGDGTPFKVFTPFSRAWVAHGWDAPGRKPSGLRLASGVDSRGVPDAPAFDGELPPVGEDAAHRHWRSFVDDRLDSYDDDRDDPGADRTSRLSPALKWGALHPRTLLADLEPRRKGHATFRTELAWREFYADVLWARPDSARAAYVEQMASMRVDTGKRADERFDAWREGRTGYPIVDAGMRQLREEAWMHNRVRMITASFLVKDLHVDWTRGARWFLDRLADGDLASNNHGWQWVAGTGTDAAPYYRIFNPVTQGRKFDPSGVYVRRWVPELASVPDRYVHCPWEADTLPLDAADYPSPIVDHKAEREEALARYQAVRS